jgi:DNA-binding CsgD family transcriptional regulator
MKHALIFIYSIALVVGTWSILYARQVDRIYRTRFLKPLANYVLLWTIWIFIYQVFEYMYENLIGQDFTTLPQIVIIPSTMIGFVILAGILYALAALSASLTNRSIHRTGKLIYTLFIVSVLGMLFAGLQSLEAEGPNIWLIVSALIFNYGLILFTVVVLGYLYLQGRRLEADNQRKIVLTLTLLLSISYLFYNGAAALPLSLALPTMSAGLFLFCAVPLIWIRWIYLPNATSPLKMNGEPAIQRLFEEYRISNREQEIIGLILEGMSNKEIEEALSISYHTVKNHIYNIFQKLGVQSRGQLIYRLLQAHNNAS